jgi:hypothetical protein
MDGQGVSGEESKKMVAERRLQEDWHLICIGP